MSVKELFIPTEGTETKIARAPRPPSSEGIDTEDPIDSTLGSQIQEHCSHGSSEHDLPMDEADNVVAEDREPEYARAEEGPQEIAFKEDEVANLKATIAELTKQQANSKGVLRRPPIFEGVHGQIVGSTLKSKKIFEFGKGGNPSSPNTRNKGKAEKVRT